MSNAGISFGGLASGLDTRAIISALMAVERRPITAMEAKKTGFNRSKSLLNDLGSLLTTVRDKANALRSTTDFLAMDASVDKEQYLTASAGSTAQPSSYQLKVLALAQAQVNSSNGQASRTSAYGDSTLELTVGGSSYYISVGGGTGYDSSLDGIAAAINAQGLDVTAEVLDTGSGGTPYQLVLRSKNTGSAGAFSISVDSGPAAMNTLINGVNTNVRTAATDAQLQINGITVTRSSNSISDAITGVTLNLKALTPTNETATLTVTTDAEATSSKVKDFVDAYNAVVDFVAEQNQLGTDGKAKSSLFGDSTLRSIRSSLRSILGGSVDTGNESYALLSQVGITADTAGKLTFNQSTFEEALAGDEAAVASLFNKSGTGLANRVYDQVAVFTDSVDGLLKARKDGFDSLIKQTQTRIDSAERRLTQYQASLDRKFSAMESLLSKLQSQGNSLSSIR